MPGKIGSELLRDLFALASHAGEGIFDRRKMSYGYEAYMDHVRLKERQVKNGLRVLERTGYISVERVSRKIQTLVLTELGRKQVLESQLKNESRMYLSKKYCQVIFDIPEADRAYRKVIRDFLKKCGFTKVQRSVWKSDRKVHEKLAKYFRNYYSHFDIRVSLCLEI